MLVAAVLTTALITRHSGIHKMSLLWVVGFGAVAVVVLYKHGLYDWRVRLQTLDDLRRVVTATVLALAAVLSLRVLLGRTEDVSAQSVRLWALATAFLVAGRAM